MWRSHGRWSIALDLQAGQLIRPAVLHDEVHAPLAPRGLLEDLDDHERLEQRARRSPIGVPGKSFDDDLAVREHSQVDRNRRNAVFPTDRTRQLWAALREPLTQQWHR